MNAPASTAPRTTVSKNVGRGAFTVLELLMAVALAAVLIGLLVVGFKPLREQGRNAKCVSQLRQVGMIILAAAADNQQRSVVAFIPGDSVKPQYVNHPQRGLMWHTYLNNQGYLPDLSIVICPSFPPYRGETKSIRNSMKTYGLRRPGTPDYTQPAAVLNQVQNPSRYVVLADSCKDPATWVGQQYYIADSTTSSTADRIHARHSSRANLFFADGGLRSLTQAEILALDDLWTTKRVDTTDYLK